MFNFYPLFIAVIGIAVSMALIEPAVRGLAPADKSVLMDAFALTRWLNLAGGVLFVLLLLWRVQVAWIALGAQYVLVMAWSVARLRNLALPSAAISRLSVAFVVRALGVSTCAAIYALRATP